MMAGVFLLPAVVDKAARADVLAPRADVDVVLHRVHGNDAVGFAIFRAEHHARADRIARRADSHRFAVDQHLAAGDARAAEHAFH